MMWNTSKSYTCICYNLGMFLKTQNRKNTYVLIISVLIIILVLVSVYFWFNQVKPHVVNYVSTASQRQFSIDVPETWKTATSSSFGGFTVFGENVPKHPDVKIYNDNKPIVAVYGNDLPQGFASTSAEVAEVMKNNMIPDYLRIYVRNYKLIQKSDITLKSGAKASLIETSFSVQSVRVKPQNFHTLNLITIKNGIMYIVTAISPEEQWDVLGKKMNDSLLSFKP